MFKLPYGIWDLEISIVGENCPYLWIGAADGTCAAVLHEKQLLKLAEAVMRRNGYKIKKDK